MSKPNNNTGNWEKELEKDFNDMFMFIESQTGVSERVRVKLFIRHILKERELEILDTLLKHGHGGGNWRRLIIQAKAKEI